MPGAKTKTCICGNEFVPETDAHEFCSTACFMEARNRPAPPPEPDPDEEYFRHIAFDEPMQTFPLLSGVNQHAERYGPCRTAEWTDVLAHAHHGLRWICVRGPANPNLWDSDGRPTSLFLHEYAHLEVPGGHTDEFWARNKALHSQFKVTHDRFDEAIGSIILSVLIIAVGLGLFIFTGEGFIGIGALIALLFTIPKALNSFGTEQRETNERECGTQG